MQTRGTSRTATIAEVNAGIFGIAHESPAKAAEWEFLCECGRSGCGEVVLLTLDAYVATRDGRGAVLAPGHRADQVERARRLTEDATALRAQAEHQARRARKNLDAGD